MNVEQADEELADEAEASQVVEEHLAHTRSNSNVLHPSRKLNRALALAGLRIREWKSIHVLPRLCNSTPTLFSSVPATAFPLLDSAAPIVHTAPPSLSPAPPAPTAAAATAEQNPTRHSKIHPEGQTAAGAEVSLFALDVSGGDMLMYVQQGSCELARSASSTIKAWSSSPSHSAHSSAVLSQSSSPPDSRASVRHLEQGDIVWLAQGPRVFLRAGSVPLVVRYRDLPSPSTGAAGGTVKEMESVESAAEAEVTPPRSEKEDGGSEWPTR
eukprot:GHVT01079068.1.p1 GENE.GHVT01079068.1~~GHVT01079068.1.p1  ORF type:complete len:270 (+),score=49.15 GHVT01079068.1:2-811(+)